MLALNEQLEVYSKDIFNQIGYSDDDEPSARIKSLVGDYIDNYQDLLAPSYTYTIKDIIEVQGKLVCIEDSIKFQSRVIARLLERCEKVAIFALTIGSYLEDLVTYLTEEGAVLQATVLDAVGSSTAETMAEQVEDRIKRIAGIRGFVTSKRFSPGYCDWVVNQQQMVFKALGDDTGGVRLTEDFLMIPQKSVSGIIGIGPAEKNIAEYNPCHACRKKECPGRRG